jgi:hypothetical protein
MSVENDFPAILQTVSAWPGPDRLRLVQAIITTMADAPAGPRRGVSAAQVLGLAAGHSVPDDATIEQWLDEHRREKYG